MKLCILYHPQSEDSRTIEEFVHEFTRRDHAVDLVSLDTREGAAQASLFGIVRYPAVVVLREDGEVVQQWEGMPLPLMDEVAGYL